MGIGRQVDRRKVLTENRLNRIFFVLFVVIVISKREQNFSFQELFFNLIFEKGEISVNIAANKRGGTPLNDSLNIALNRMQLIMDNMLKTSDSIYKLMTGMKSEEFADKMVNDTVFRARYDKIEKNFLAQMDSVSHCIKDYKNSIVGVYLFSVGGMMMPFDDMKILMKEASPMFSQNNLVRNIVEKKNQAETR